MDVVGGTRGRPAPGRVIAGRWAPCSGPARSLLRTESDMLDDFTSAEIQTGETSIFVRSHGSGPPILLLHSFPETHLMWRGAAACA